MTSEAATAGTEEVELEVSEKKKMRKKKLASHLAA